MSETPLTIKLYYDYKSPFTYLAMAPAYALMESHRVRLNYIPRELNVRGAYGGDLDQRSERDWRKVRYLYLDARRYARLHHPYAISFSSPHYYKVELQNLQ